MPSKNSKSETKILPDRLEAGDVSLKKLSFGLWYLRNRHLFISLAIGALALIAVSGWIYSFYGLGRYFIIDREQDRLSLLDMAQTGVNLLAGRINRPLNLGEVKVLGNNPSDLVVELYNPNEKTAVYFTYSFIVNGQTIAQRDGFILPSQRKYLTALGQPVPAGSAVQLVISQTRWQRINPRQIPDWSDFLASHDQLVIADRQISLTTGNGQPVSQVKFRLDNRTAYGYWSMPVLMLAYQGNNLTGINELVLTKLRSGESRAISFAWPELSGADRLEIVPVIDYLDQGNYLPVEN